MMLSLRNKSALGRGLIRQIFMKFIRMYLKKNNFFYKNIYPFYDQIIKHMPNLLFPKEHLIIPNAEYINKKAVNWVKRQNKKYFLWIHYMDVHEPYAPPDYKNRKEMLYLITKYRDFPNMLSKNEIKKLIKLYDLSIKYTDKMIGSLLEKLNCLENSIIIISADHGDAFGEHIALGHGDKYLTQLYDEVIHVPLIIYGTEKKEIIIDKQVQLLDLGPTICEIINIPIPPNFYGNSLFSKTKKGMIINSINLISYRTKEYKLIINKTKQNKNELFDLKKDPVEKINIYNTNKKVRKKMESELTSLLFNYKKKQKLLDVIKKF